MKGFILLAANVDFFNRFTISDLEFEIKRRNLKFSKSCTSNKVYEKVIGYQLFNCNDEIEDSSADLFMAGDLYGLFQAYNQSQLNYLEAKRLISNCSLATGYIPFDGNVCVASIFEDKIVFQTDLEGYRKIFYYQDSNLLCISSYLPLILKALTKDWKIRRNAVISFICSRESKWPLTFVEGVFSLPPLSRAEVTKEGLRISSKTFSDFYELKRVSKSNLREQLYNRYKLVAERKLGQNTAVTLSGGFDSNCLAKLYANISKNNFTAISVGYNAKRERDSNTYDETEYAKNAARSLGIPFKKYYFDRKDYFNEFDNFIDTIDQPGLDPSSNYLMNKYLHQDKFDLVVNGMGGDANYSSKRTLSLELLLFQLTRKLGIKPFQTLGKYCNYQGPFRLFKGHLQKGSETGYFDMLERNQLFSSPICKYITESTLREVDNERGLRMKFWNNLYDQRLVNQELFYSLALFSNPDEYHALSMAERNDIEILMPFVDTKSVLLIMNGSHFHKIANRDFEMSIFGGINTKLLLKVKSGLSIPYSEWIPPLANAIFEYYTHTQYFEGGDFDIKAFQQRYQTDEIFSKSNMANIILWKLLVVQNYINNNSLSS